MPVLTYEIPIRTLSSSLPPDKISFKDSEIDYTRLGNIIEDYSNNPAVSAYGYIDPPIGEDGKSLNLSSIFLKRNIAVETKNSTRFIPQFANDEWSSKVFIEDRSIHCRVYERHGSSEYIAIDFTSSRKDKFKFGGTIAISKHPPHDHEQGGHDHGDSLIEETESSYGVAKVYTKLPLDNADIYSGLSTVSTEDYDSYSVSLADAISRYGDIDKLKSRSEKVKINRSTDSSGFLLVKNFPIYSSALIFKENGTQIFPDMVDQISGAIKIDASNIQDESLYVMYGVIPAIVSETKEPDFYKSLKYNSNINLLEIKSDNVQRFSFIPSDTFDITPHDERLSVKIALNQSIDSFSIKTSSPLSLNGEDLNANESIYLKNDGINFIDIYAPNDITKLMEPLKEDGDKYVVPNYKSGIFAIIGLFDSGLYPIVLSKKRGPSDTSMTVKSGTYFKLPSVTTRDRVTITTNGKNIPDENWEFINPGIVYIKKDKNDKDYNVNYEPLIDLTNTTIYVRDGKFTKSSIQQIDELGDSLKQTLVISSKKISLPVTGYSNDNPVYINGSIELNLNISEKFIKEMIEKWEI